MRFFHRLLYSQLPFTFFLQTIYDLPLSKHIFCNRMFKLAKYKIQQLNLEFTFI